MANTGKIHFSSQAYSTYELLCSWARTDFSAVNPPPNKWNRQAVFQAYPPRTPQSPRHSKVGMKWLQCSNAWRWSVPQHSLNQFKIMYFIRVEISAGNCEHFTGISNELNNFGSWNQLQDLSSIQDLEIRLITTNRCRWGPKQKVKENLSSLLAKSGPYALMVNNICRRMICSSHILKISKFHYVFPFQYPVTIPTQFLPTCGLEASRGSKWADR